MSHRDPLPGSPRLAPRRVAAVVLGLAALQLLTLAARPWTSTAELVLDVGSAVAGLALVPVLLRRPVAAGVVLGALAALSPVATPAATCAVLVVALCRPFRTAVGVALVGMAAHLVLGLWRPAPGLSFGWWAVLVVVGYATLVGWGAYVQARRALLASLCERAERAESEQARRVVEARTAERARIAREMHDVLAHRLSLVATHAGALEYRPDASPERVALAAGVVRAGVHQALEELREVIWLLRSDEEGAADGEAARPQPTLADLQDLLAENRAAGSEVALDEPVPALTAVPPGLGRAAYRILQEALTNARRHAPGQPVQVRIAGAPGDALELSVRNRVTHVARAETPGSGTGLLGLAERVNLVGGDLTTGRCGGEFRLLARLPWPDERA